MKKLDARILIIVGICILLSCMALAKNSNLFSPSDNLVITSENNSTQSTVQFANANSNDEFKGKKLLNKSDFVGVIMVTNVSDMKTGKDLIEPDPLSNLSKNGKKLEMNYNYRVVEANIVEEYKNVKKDIKLKIFAPDDLIGIIINPENARYNIGDKLLAYYEFDEKLQMYKAITYENGLYKINDKKMKSVDHDEDYDTHKKFIKDNLN